jgi:hypothetical protein
MYDIPIEDEVVIRGFKRMMLSASFSTRGELCVWSTDPSSRTTLRKYATSLRSRAQARSITGQWRVTLTSSAEREAAECPASLARSHHRLHAVPGRLPGADPAHRPRDRRTSIGRTPLTSARSSPQARRPGVQPAVGAVLEGRAEDCPTWTRRRRSIWGLLTTAGSYAFNARTRSATATSPGGRCGSSDTTPTSFTRLCFTGPIRSQEATHRTRKRRSEQGTLDPQVIMLRRRDELFGQFSRPSHEILPLVSLPNLVRRGLAALLGVIAAGVRSDPGGGRDYGPYHLGVALTRPTPPTGWKSLLEVKGIGDKKMATIRSSLRIPTRSRSSARQHDRSRQEGFAEARAAYADAHGN